MRKRNLTRVITTALLVSLLLMNMSSANTYGGKWTSNPLYYVSSSFAYYSQVTNAIPKWNSKLTSYTVLSPVTYKSTTLLGATVLFQNGVYSSVTWTGHTDIYPGTTSIPYSSAMISFKTSAMGLLTPSEKNIVAIHELGHATGLAHTLNLSNKSIMYEYLSDINDQGVTDITAYDVTQLALIY